MDVWPENISAIAVPQELYSIPACLAHKDVREEKLPYSKSSWMKYFGNDPDFLECAESNDSLSRQDFVRVGKGNAAVETRSRRLFITAMLWGYGNVGYGAYRTHQMLSTPNADSQIQSAFDLVRRGKIVDAYDVLHLYKCGPAFMSKFLYAAGLCTKAEPLPLILDSNVARSLKDILGKQEDDCSQFFRLTENEMVMRFSEGYARYVRLLNHWAVELAALPDQIELYLFERGRK